MFRKLLGYAKGYGVYAILSPLTIVLEVLIEVAIPFLMSVIIDSGINGIPLSEKLTENALMSLLKLAR